MKVRMKVGISGTRDGVPWPGIGEILDTDPREAAELVQLGHADPVETEADDASSVDPGTPAKAAPRRRRTAVKDSGEAGVR